MIEHREWGRMFYCPTPIGNLKDVTQHALDILRQVHAVICEDTRVTRKLLSHYDIHKPLFSFHTHNRPRSTETIIALLQEGNDLALVTDAGTPGIQDPGGDLINHLEEAGVSLEVLPGPTALIPAAVLSGFCTHGFVFLGFLPRKQGARLAVLERYASGTLPVILYESPHRLLETLRDTGACYGPDREVFLCRELSKRFEERMRGTVREVIDNLTQRSEVKGEIVLVIRERGAKSNRSLTDAQQSLLRGLRELGIGKKEILKLFAGLFPGRNNLVKHFLNTLTPVDFSQDSCFNKNRSGR